MVENLPDRDLILCLSASAISVHSHVTLCKCSAWITG